MEPSTTTTTSSLPSEFLTTVQTRQTFFSVAPSAPLPAIPEPLPVRYDPQSFPPTPLPSTPETELSPETSFRQYATKLGYPENLINRVLADLGADAGNEELITHLIELQDMLCPSGSTQPRRRRDATDLPSYMLVQDSYYKGKERMPFWVWVKRETIGVNVTANPPHRRDGNRTRSRSNSSATPNSAGPSTS